MIKVSQAMVKCLEKENIKVVFGYPGAAICPFYDALEDSEIQHILVRHEANAGHAASGYARITGKPAVCIATSGPGATNLITAIATAYMDSIPLVVITGQVSSELIGRDVFQEADITGAAEPFVKHSYLVKNAEDIPRIFKEAFYISGTGRPGPVLIDIPVDVQNVLIDFSYPKTVEIRSYKPSTKGNALQIKRVLTAIENAKKPIICAGGGVFASNAQDEVKALSELCQIPMVTTMMGISCIPTDSPLYFGMLGMHGIKTANIAIKDCDVLILIGARVGDRAVKSPIIIQETTQIIHIDIDPAEIGKNMTANIPLVGDAKLILKELLEIAKPLDHSEWLKELNLHKNKVEYKEPQQGCINPKQFIAMLSEAMPENSTIVADVGQNQIWTAMNYKIKQGRFLTSGGMGTMGYSVPAAIGAKLANKKNAVVAICGDGSFQMQMMELATAIQHNVDIKIIVMRNNRLGMVRELQTNFYANKLTAVNLDGTPDFILLAKAYGIDSVRVNSAESAEIAIKKLSSSKGMLLVECIVLPDESTL